MRKISLFTDAVVLYLTALLKVVGKVGIQVGGFLLHIKHAVLIQLSSLGS